VAFFTVVVMSPRNYLYTLLGVAAVGWAAFALVIIQMEPCTAAGEITICHSVSTGSLSLFFLSLLVALLGTFIGLGFLMRFGFNDDVYKEHLAVSARQGIFLTICCLGGLALLILQALTWWSGLLMLVIILVMELYFTRAGS